MRRSLPLLIILGIVVILLFWGCGSYNNLVQQDEVVKKSWNDVQSQYQRRADLIPNLVNTVKGEANFERGTLNDVINARARATSMQISPENLTPENIEKISTGTNAIVRSFKPVIGNCGTISQSAGQ